MKFPVKILVTDEMTTPAVLRLRAKNVEVTQSAHFPAAADLSDMTVMIIRSRTKIDEKLLALAPKLKLIVTATSGTDHIDLGACERQGIRVMSTPEAQTLAAAELTLFLMLATLRRATQVQQALRQFLWKDAVLKGGELNGKVVGIIGLGRVGGRVAELVQAFGATVVAHDPYQDDAKFEKLNVKRLGLTEVLVQSQILTLHVPLTKETRHIINASTMDVLPEDAILINTSRGSVVDEGDLLRALETGGLLAAGIDVFESEPLGKETRLRKLKNVVLTPHIGAYTDEAFERASMLAVDHVLSWLSTHS